MPTFSIYTLGEATSFFTTLNSVAMIFNQTAFISGVQLTAALVALIAVLVGLVLGVGGEKGKNPPVTTAFFFGAMVVLSGVKSSVLVTDIYSGSTVQVDNIPIIISIPSSVFTTGSYKLFQYVDTAYQSTNGSYQSISSSGYVLPLKLLYSLRRGVEKADPYLVATIQQFIIDCVPGSSVTLTGFRNDVDYLEYILSNSRPSGLTNYYNAANPSGLATSCPDNVARIQTDAATFITSTSFRQLINQNVREKNPVSSSGFAISDVVAAYDNNIGNVLGASQSSSQFMKNALFYTSVTDTFKCMDSASNQSDFTMCNIMLTQGSEQWKADSTANGSFFAKLMMPAMVFLQLMFFGLAPLVILYSLFLGAGSVGMYVKFLGFGVWTSSWLPFAAVIQMYIQNNVADKLAGIQSTALTAGNYEAIMYDILSTRLALASDLLAATPMVSLALLSGSIYGLSSLAGRWSGRDYSDEKQTAPSLLKQDAAVSIGSGTTALNQGGNLKTISTAGFNEGASISASDTLQKAINDTSSNSVTNSRQTSEEFGKMLQKMSQSGVSAKDMSQFMEQSGITKSQGYKTAMAEAQSIADKSTMTDEEKRDFFTRTQVSAGLSAALGFNVLGSGAQVKGAIEGSTGNGKTVTKAQQKAFEELQKKDISFSKDDSVVRSAATQSSNSQALEKMYSKSFGENDSHSYREALSRTVQDSQTLSSLQSASQGIQRGLTVTSSNIADAIRNDISGVNSVVAKGASDLKRDIGEDKFANYQRSAENFINSNKFERNLTGNERDTAVNFHAMRLAQEDKLGSSANYFKAVGAVMGQDIGRFSEVKPSAPAENTVPHINDNVSKHARAGGNAANGAVAAVASVNSSISAIGAKATTGVSPDMDKEGQGIRGRFDENKGLLNSEGAAKLEQWKIDHPVEEMKGVTTDPHSFDLPSALAAANAMPKANNESGVDKARLAEPSFAQRSFEATDPNKTLVSSAFDANVPPLSANPILQTAPHEGIGKTETDSTSTTASPTMGQESFPVSGSAGRANDPTTTLAGSTSTDTAGAGSFSNPSGFGDKPANSTVTQVRTAQVPNLEESAMGDKSMASSNPNNQTTNTPAKSGGSTSTTRGPDKPKG